MNIKPNYRPNAAVIVVNENGQVLLCYRVDVPEYTQTIQGGIDEGETPEEAARREIKEEIGINADQFEFKAYLLGTHKYDWTPEIVERLKESGFTGQEQHFFLAEVDSGVEFDLDFHEREFSKVEWGTPKELIDGAWENKKPGLTAALKGFGLLK